MSTGLWIYTGESKHTFDILGETTHQEHPEYLQRVDSQQEIVISDDL
jgi:hypothetical protein